MAINFINTNIQNVNFDKTSLTEIKVDGICIWTGKGLFTFSLLTDGTYSVKATKGVTLPSILEIPSTFNGKKVKGLTSQAFEYCEELVGVIIPDGVKWVEANAFIHCSNLEWVVFPNSIDYFGDYVFHQSDNLKAIYYKGTESEWAGIDKGTGNGWAAVISWGVHRYYYSETKPTTEGNYWHYVDGTPSIWGSLCENGHTYECVTVDATCTEKGNNTYTCSVCGNSYVEEISAKGHKYSSVVKSPTCTEGGYTTYTCTRTGCTHSYVEEIEALGHNYVDWQILEDATCTTTGRKRRYCVKCNVYDYQDIPALDHTPSDWIIDKNANGSEDGSRHKVCTVCGTVLETEIIPAPCEPTATSYFAFTLLEDDTYSIAAKDATNMPTKVFLPTEYNGKAVTVIGKHAFMDCTDIEYVFIPSSITTIGYGAFAYCYNLGTAWIPHTVTTVDWGVFSYTGTAVYIDIHYPPYPPTGWNEDWDIYLPEGAVHWGVSFSEMFNTSLLSDATYEVTATETALANDYIYIPDSHEGTDITSIGASAFAGSSATGVRIGDNITLIGKLAFSGAKMHMIKLPLKVDTIKPLAFSNMPEGTVIYCEANSKPSGWADDWCDDSVTVVWGDGCAAGHSYKSVVTPPTCTTKGYTTHTCEECGDSYVDSYTDPTGVHNWSAWEETKAPQCATEGEEKRTCSVCGATETRAIEATGHHYSISDEVDSTCTEKGYIEYTCDECLADSYRVEKELDPDNHDWDVEVEVVESTCTEQGYTIHTCNACGETYKDNYTDMISHTYDLTLVEPTCTEQGYVDHICQDCGHSYKDAYTEALGHSPSDWIIDKEATVEAEGSKHKECTRCGVVLETAIIPKVDDSIYLVTEAGEYLTDEQGNLLIL